MNDVWKSLDFMGYPNYEVSNMGDVRSLNYGLMSDKRVNKKGYRKVRLCKNGEQKEFLVHRLVAFAFVENPNPEEFNVVNHMDENKLNNRADNLEWCTNEYNITYGTAIQRRVETMFKNNSWNCDELKELNRKPVYKYDLCGNLIHRFDGMNICYNEDRVNSQILLSDTPIKNDYVYSYKELTNDDINKLIKLKQDREESMKVKVYKYDFDGNIVDIIEDVRSVDYNARSNILDCCNNDKLSYNGYIWSYCEKTYEEVYNIVSKIKHYRIIYRYDLKDMSCKEYKDIDCVEGGLNKQYIKNCCNGMLNSYSGSIWSYDLLSIDEINRIKTHIEVGSKVKVYQYNLLGEFVKKWDSIEDCIRAGFIKTGLHDCFNNISHQHNGYIWSKVELKENEIADKIENVINNTKTKPVYQYTKEGIFVDAFNTVVIASNTLNISAAPIHECCRKLRKSYKGYLWSYRKIE